MSGSRSKIDGIVFPETLTFDPQAAVDTLITVRSLYAEMLGALNMSVSSDRKNIHLGPLEIPRQVVISAGGHSLHPELNLGFLQELWDEGKDSSQYAIWHSHATMGAWASGIDVRTALDQMGLLLEIAMFAAEDPEEEITVGPYMELVFNIQGQVCADMYFLHKGVGLVGQMWDGRLYEALRGRDPILQVKRINFPQAESAFSEAIASFPEELVEERKEVIGRVFREKVTDRYTGRMAEWLEERESGLRSGRGYICYLGEDCLTCRGQKSLDLPGSDPRGNDDYWDLLI